MARPVELILAKQWAGMLTVPVLLFDHTGDLIFYNESAEVHVGRSYNDQGPLVRAEWSTTFNIENEEGEDMNPDETPMAVALDRNRPAQATCWIRSMDGVRRCVRITAFPIEGMGPRRLGVMTLFSTVT